MDFLLGARLKELNGPVLVTGHTGFKGTWLTLLLEELGVSVVGYALPPHEDSLYSRLGRTNQIPEIYGDIRDLSSVKKAFSIFEPAAVIHLAAQPLVIESYETPIETFETNVMGTVNILDTAIKSNSVKGIVAVTTDKVYRNDDSGKQFLESDPLSGEDPYSASKVGTESVVKAYQNISSIKDGPAIVVVRSGNVVGGGDMSDNRLMPDLIKALYNKNQITIRNPKSTRPWQHVLDPLAGYLLSLEKALIDRKHSAYNFGPQGFSLSVEFVAEIALNHWDDSLAIKDVVIAEKLQEIESIQLNLDSNKAEAELGWRPQWNQVDAVVATVVWWKAALNAKSNVVHLCKNDIAYLLSAETRTINEQIT
jgi:CDP-glucose 4,6-dehydratase